MAKKPSIADFFVDGADNSIDKIDSTLDRTSNRPSIKDFSPDTTQPIEPKFENLPADSQFDKTLIPETADNLNEIRANRQGLGYEITGGIGNAVVKTLAETAKLPGVAQGIVEWGLTGFDTQQIDKAFKNQWLTNIDNLDAAYKETFPVYIQNAVNEGTVGDMLSSPEWWATTGADGVGYMASMMLPGAALSKLGAGAKIGAGTGKFLTNIGATTRGKAVGSAVGEIADFAVVSGTNSYIEAISESKELYDKVYNTELKKAYDKHLQVQLGLGKDPQEASNVATEWAEKDAKNIASESAASGFKGNMALLAVSNGLDQAFFMKSFYKALKGSKYIDDAAEMASKSAKGLLDDSGKIATSFTAKTGKETLKDIGKIIPASIAKEGFLEEGTQFSIANYYENKENYKNDEGFLDAVSGVLANYVENIGDNAEMQSSIALGAFLGSLMSTGHQVYSDVQENKSKAKLHSILKDNLVNSYNSQTDLYAKDANGNIVIEDGKAKLDPNKLAEFGNQMSETVFNNMNAEQALLNNKDEQYDFIKDIQLFNAIKPTLEATNNPDIIKGYIKSMSADMVEYAKKNGLNEQEALKLEQDLNSKVDTFKGLLNKETNIHRATYKSSIEDKEVAKQFDTHLLNKKLTEALLQNFIIDKNKKTTEKLISKGISKNDTIETIDELAKDIDNGITPADVIELKEAFKQNQQYKKDFSDSIERYKKLLNPVEIAKLEKSYQKNTKDVEDYVNEEVANEELNNVEEGLDYQDDKGIVYTTSRLENGALLLTSKDGKNKIQITNFEDFKNKFTPYVESQEVPTESTAGVITSEQSFNDKLLGKESLTGVTTSTESLEKPEETAEGESIFGEDEALDEGTSVFDEEDLDEGESIFDNEEVTPETELKKLDKQNITDTSIDDTGVKDVTDTVILEIKPPITAIGSKLATKSHYNENVANDEQTLAKLTPLYAQAGIEIIPNRIPNEYASARRHSRFLYKNNLSDGKFVIKIVESITDADNVPYDIEAADIAKFDNPAYGKKLYTVFGIIENNTFIPVDETGKKIQDSEIGTKGIYTFMPLPVLTYRDSNLGDNFYVPTELSYEEALIIANEKNEAYKELRIAIVDKLSKGEEVALKLKSKSNGLVMADVNRVTSTVNSKPINKMPDVFSDNYTIEILTEDVNTINDAVVRKSKGQVVYKDLTSGNTFFVDSRVLTNEEVDLAIALLEKYVQAFKVDKQGRISTTKKAFDLTDNEGFNSTIEAELKKFLYYTGDNRKDSTKPYSLENSINRNEKSQFYIKKGKTHKESKLIIRGNEIDLFDQEALKRNEIAFNINAKALLLTVLPSMTHQVSNLHLKNNNSFSKLDAINEDSSLKVKVYDSYSKYLKESVLTSSILPITDDKIVNSDATIVTEQSVPLKSQYALYDNQSLFTINSSLVEKSVEPITTPIVVPESTEPTPSTEDKNKAREERLKNKSPRKSSKDKFLDRKSLHRTGVFNETAAKAWFEDKVGSSNKIKIKKILDNGAWGRFVDNSIILSEEGDTDTIYHEAFHYITELYFRPNELAKILNSWRSDNSDKKVTDKELKEILAEEFREYINSSKTETPKYSWFEKLKIFIKSVLRLNQNTNYKDLFKEINSGAFKYKKQVNKHNSTNAMNRMPNQSDSFTDLALRSVNYEFFGFLYSDGFNIHNINKINPDTIYDSIIEEYEATMLEKLQEIKTVTDEVEKAQIQNIIDNLDAIIASLEDTSTPNSLRNLHQAYLSKYNITINESTENEIDNSLDDNKGKDSGSSFLATKSLSISVKDTASFEVKLLLSSIIDATIDEDTGKTIATLSELGLPMAVDYSTTASALFNALGGSANMDDMIYRLNNLRKIKPNIKQVMMYFKLLDTPTTKEEWDLRNKFYATFHNQKNTFELLSIDLSKESAKQIVTIDTTLNSRKNRITNQWQNNAINNFVTDKDGNYVYSDKLKKELITPKFESDYRKFFKQLGITFSNIENAQIYRYKDIAHSIRNSILSGETTNLFIDEQSDVNSYFNTLVTLEATTTIDSVENSHITPSGDKQYNVSQNSYISQVLNELLTYKTRDEFLANNPHYNDPYLTNSQLLSLGGNIYNTNGTLKSNLNIGNSILEGLGEYKGDFNSYEDVSIADKGLFYILSLNKNQFPMFRPSDNKIFRNFSFGLLVKSNDRTEHIEQMKKYFADELYKYADTLGRIDKYKNENLKRGILIDIVNKFGSEFIKTELETLLTKPKLNKADIDSFIDTYGSNTYKVNDTDVSLYSAFDKYIKDAGKRTLDYLTKNKTLKKVPGGYRRLGETYAESMVIRGMENTAVKHLFGMVEQTKLFFGHPVYYGKPNNFFKRMSGPIGTKQFPNTERALTEWMLQNMPRLLDNKIQSNLDNPTVQTVTFQDLTLPSTYLEEYAKLLSKEDLRAYENLNTGDGQGYITLDEYREFYYRMGLWSDTEEKLYQWEAKYYKATKEEKIELKKSKPSGMFNPMKFQEFGPLAEKYFVPSFFKLSLFPLVPSVIEDRAIEKLHKYLLDNKIGIGVFDSGIKVGTKLNSKGKVNNIFDENHDINITENLVIQNTYMKYWGNQLNIPQHLKPKAPAGTQMAKQIISGLKDENGVYINGEAETLYNNIININDQRITLELNTLIDKLGLERKDGIYNATKGIDALKSTLKAEYIKRNMSDNAIESLEYINENGIDVLPNRVAVEQMLFAIADKKVVRKSRKGTMAVQVSVAMMDIGKKAYDKVTVGDKTFNSSDLKTYSQVEGRRYTEVYLPSMYKGKIDINQELDPRLLEIVGFRIPTQGPNSIEYIRVKDFLPEEAGNIIILPREIVAKSGSDFDIDKLNLYFPNVYYDGNNKPIYIDENTTYEEYSANTKDVTDEESSINSFKIMQLENQLLDNYKQILGADFNFKNLITPISSVTLEQEAKELKQLKPAKEIATDWFSITEIPMAIDRAMELLGSQKGIGIAATQATSHIQFQHADLKLNPSIKIKQGVAYKDVSTSIYFPHNEKDGLIWLGGAYTQGNETIGALFNETITGFVDAANNPFIFDLINDLNTTNTFMYMLRAGVPLKTVVLFLNQPIIVDYLKGKAIGRSIAYTTNEAETKIVDGEETKLKKKGSDLLKGIAKKYGTNSTIAKEFTNSELEDMIKTTTLTDDTKKAQNQLLNDYFRYESSADAVRAVVQSLSFDTAPAKNTSQLLSKNTNVNNIIKSGWFEQESLNRLYNDGFITPYKNVSSTLEDIYSNFISALNNPRIKKLLTDFIEMYADPSVSMSQDDKTLAVEALRTELYTFMMQTGGNITSKFESLFKGSSSLAVQLKALKNDPIYAENYFIKNLDPIIRGNKPFDSINLRTIFVDSATEQLLVDGWKQLYDINPIFADNLIDFVLIQSGMLNSPMNFIRFAPADKFAEKFNTNSHILQNFNQEDFLLKFYQNNYNTDKIIPKYPIAALPFYKKWTKDAKVEGKKPSFTVNIYPNKNWKFGTITGDNFTKRATKIFNKNISMIDYGTISINPSEGIMSLTLQDNTVSSFIDKMIEENNQPIETQETTLDTINENLSKAGIKTRLTIEKWNTLTKEQQDKYKECYG
jgi:hypothetical protein